MMCAERAGVQPISVLYGTTGSYMFGLGVTTNERNNIAALVAVKSELKSLNRKNELTKNGNWEPFSVENFGNSAHDWLW